MLFHGRGSDEHDLVGVLDLLDPDRRLLGVTPGGPLALPPGGRHWYAVQRIGFPDPATFLPTVAALDDWLAALAVETGIPIGRTVLGGFSQGAVMTFALGLAAGGRPAALVPLSGFIPTVPGFDSTSAARRRSRSAIAPTTTSSRWRLLTTRGHGSTPRARPSSTASRRTPTRSIRPFSATRWHRGSLGCCRDAADSCAAAGDVPDGCRLSGGPAQLCSPGTIGRPDEATRRPSNRKVTSTVSFLE